MYNETCEKCKTTGHEMLIDGMCFSCVEKALAKYDTLQASHTKLLEALGNMVTQFIKYTPQFKPEHDKCWEVIQAKQALSEAEKIT